MTLFTITLSLTSFLGPSNYWTAQSTWLVNEYVTWDRIESYVTAGDQTDWLNEINQYNTSIAVTTFLDHSVLSSFRGGEDRRIVSNKTFLMFSQYSVLFYIFSFRFPLFLKELKLVSKVWIFFVSLTNTYYSYFPSLKEFQ